MKKHLQQLVSCYSWNQVHAMWSDGRINDATWYAYDRVWGWSAVRWSNPYGERQEWFWEKYGKDKFYAKINKVRAAFGFDLITP